MIAHSHCNVSHASLLLHYEVIFKLSSISIIGGSWTLLMRSILTNIYNKFRENYFLQMENEKRNEIIQTIIHLKVVICAVMEETETKEADIGTNSTSVSASVTVEEIQAPKKGHHNPFSFVSKLLGMFGSKHGSKDGSRGSNLSNAGSSSNAASPRFGSPNRFIINNKAEYFFTGGESVILRLNSKTTVSSHSPAPSVSSLDPSSLLSTAMKKGAANARYYLPAHLLKRMGGEKGLNQNEMYEASRRVYDPTTKIIKEGYLEKQGYTNINLWKRRYFVLKGKCGIIFSISLLSSNQI